ncbi:MAG TPA: alpha-L-arabinofuranosidase C-terminal domain-containing protein [Calditrichia bacterium]|nr:alpha-L-arabinofuranosidase C-terminal domain-containing protein [Calditrichia bacterium]
MLRHLFICLVLLAGSSLMAQDLSARIKIDKDRVIGDIDKNIYGNFSEHLGRCIYGGIYDPGSKLSDKQGFRKDVLEAAKGLNVPILRWPGGNFVSGYHWEDGIGPKKDRPERTDLAWHTPEPNTFGTDEFIDYCRKMGTEPYFAVNLGTGTFDEARNWVEYCNVKEGPYYAELRKKNGHPEPHNVKYWSLGNEVDGWWQMGHKNAEDYGKFALEAAKLMKWTSPDIKLIAAGSSNFYGNSDPHGWNRTVLEYLKDYIDYIALHRYVGNRENDYYAFMASTIDVEERTKIVEAQIDEAMSKMRNPRQIYVAWDEYNVWYRARGGEAARGRNALEEKYNLEDALVIAGFLNAFIRNAHIVKMANMAQLVNVIAPIFTNENDMFRQTIYFPLALYANNSFGQSLDVLVDGPTFDTKQYQQVPYLDVSVAYQGEEVVINVVNRHKDQPITAEIISQEGQFSGPFTVFEVNGPDVKTENTFGKEVIKSVKKDDVAASGAGFSYTFPAHSYTMLKGKLK